MEGGWGNDVTNCKFILPIELISAIVWINSAQGFSTNVLALEFHYQQLPDISSTWHGHPILYLCMKNETLISCRETCRFNKAQHQHFKNEVCLQLGSVRPSVHSLI